MAVGWCSFIQKYGALAFIVLQTSLLVVVMHVSRTAKGDMYAPSTAVVTMEFIKMGSSLAFVLIFDNNWSIVNTVQSLHREIISQPQELINSSVPSFLYVIQNNLLYYALSHLDPATYQVVYNLKILTTAVFSMTILSKPISQLQWLSLVILTIGVALAQYSGQARSSHGFQNTWLGFAAVIAASFISGFAGVTSEKLLKSAATSMWMRNVQMGVSSISGGLLGVYLSGELPGVWNRGFFHGYNWTVFWVVMLQASGGLGVAVAMRYTDNILKGFAASFSIITSCIITYIWFDFQPSSLFILGASFVLASMYLYKVGDPGAVKQKTEAKMTAMAVVGGGTYGSSSSSSSAAAAGGNKRGSGGSGGVWYTMDAGLIV